MNNIPALIFTVAFEQGRDDLATEVNIMKQSMSVREAFECYVSCANHGTEFLKKHFPDRYSGVELTCKITPVSAHLYFTPVKDDDGVDIIQILREGPCMDEAGKFMDRNACKMVHTLSSTSDDDKVFVMEFTPSGMRRSEAVKYMKMLGVM